MKLISAIMREPLVHFLLIGLLVFVAYDRLTISPPDSGSGNQIEITLDDVTKMVMQFETTWRRPPTATELDVLIEARIRESILVEEARALSMDQGDAIINQRLSQKMTFLLDSAARANAPSDEDLQAYFEENKDTYKTRPLISFESVYLGDAPEEADVRAVLDALSGGADPASLGTRTMLPARLPLSPPAAIDGIFGRGFFEAVTGVETGRRTAPVRSGFGVHAVRVIDRSPGAVPDLDAVMDQVSADYTRAAAAEVSQALYAELRERYLVKISPTPLTLTGACSELCPPVCDAPGSVRADACGCPGACAAARVS